MCIIFTYTSYNVKTYQKIQKLNGIVVRLLTKTILAIRRYVLYSIQWVIFSRVKRKKGFKKDFLKRSTVNPTYTEVVFTNI